MYASILKYNVNHDQRGLFASRGSPGSVLTGAAKAQRELEDLAKQGLSVSDPKAAAALWHEFSPKVGPAELVDTMLGKNWKAEGGSITVSKGFAHIIAEKGTFHGVSMDKVTRSFDFKNGVVTHKILVLSKSSQGAGAVKKMMATSIPLYQTLGMKKINCSANIDAGAYAWSRYGFQADKPQDYARTMAKQIKAAKFPKMTPEQKLEHTTVLKVIQEHKTNPALPTILTSMQTPHLTARYLSENTDARKGSNFLSHAMSGSEWEGHLMLNDQAQLDRLGSYVGAKFKKG